LKALEQNFPSGRNIIGTGRHYEISWCLFFRISLIFKLDSLENQQEIILNIYKSIKKGKPLGNVKSIRKSFHRRNVFITHEYNMNLFDELCSEKI
jgi:hypothetical protein